MIATAVASIAVDGDLADTQAHDRLLADPAGVDGVLEQTLEVHALELRRRQLVAHGDDQQAIDEGTLAHRLLGAVERRAP